MKVEQKQKRRGIESISYTHTMLPQWLQKVLVFLNSILFVILFLFISCFLVIFLERSVSLTGGEPPRFLEVFSASILNLLGLKHVSAQSSLDVVINFLAISLAVFSSILPISVYLITRQNVNQRISEIENENPFKTHLIKTEKMISMLCLTIIEMLDKLPCIQGILIGSTIMTKYKKQSRGW